jgi:hypothetical protein
MEKSFEYRESTYFNDTDTFVFVDNCNMVFESKVHFEKGNWWTNEGLNYKCTSIKCYKK